LIRLWSDSGMRTPKRGGWLELDLQRLHLSHRRSRAYRVTTHDVRQVLAHYATGICHMAQL
jgi:hypothetical protein